MIIEQIKRCAHTIGMDKAIADSSKARIVQEFIGVVSVLSISSFLILIN